MSDDAEDRSDWPDVLRRLAELLGGDVALRLANECGGLDKVAIPHAPTPGHLWRKVLDEEQFAKVCAAFGGERIWLPRGRFVQLAKRRILELHEGGASLRQIALQAQCSENYVRRVLGNVGAKRHDDPRQRKLFD